MITDKEHKMNIAVVSELRIRACAKDIKANKPLKGWHWKTIEAAKNRIKASIC